MLTNKLTNLVIILLVLSIFILDYLSVGLGILPRKVSWLPDLVAVALSVIVILPIAIKKKIELPKRYIFFFILYSTHLGLGCIFNGMPPGAIIAGIRTYFRFLPLFFLPAAYDITAKQVIGQLKLLIVLSLLQVPLSIYQRFFQFKGLQTGDVVSGTLNTTPVLGIFQISIICLFISWYNRGKMSIRTVLLLCCFIFIPCTINETKAVIIFLPLSILAINHFADSGVSKLKRYTVVPLVLLLLIGLFVPVYDHFIEDKWGGRGLYDFFTREGRVVGYLYKGNSPDSESDQIGRIDSMLFAVKEISESPLRLIFGFGMGNVTLSFIRQFSGDYMEFDKLGARMTTITCLLWETGFGGVLILSLLFIFHFFDALSLRQSLDIRGDIALASIGVGTMLFISLVYVDLVHKNFSFLIWYFAGYIAAENFRFVNERWAENQEAG